MSKINSMAQDSKPIRRAAITMLVMFCLGLPALSLQAASLIKTKAKPSTTFTIAQLYSTGDYGLEVDTEMLATVFKLSYRTRDWGASISLPYLDITGPATAVYEDIDTGDLFLVDIDDENRNGFGDMVISADGVAWRNRRKGMRLHLGGAIKLPTGDEMNRLSTGETDISLFAKGRVRKNKNLLNGQIGYQIMGDTEFTDYDNRLFATAGVYRFIDRQLGIGGSLRYKQASLGGRDDQFSASAFVTHKMTKDWSVGLRANRGLSDAVADFSAGLTLSYRHR